jgi:hypothetical protein
MSSTASSRRPSLTVDGDNLEDLGTLVGMCVEMNIGFDLSIDMSELSRPELLDAWPLVRRVLVRHAADMRPLTHTLVVRGSKTLAASAPAGMGTTVDMELYLREHGVLCDLRCELL